MIFPAIPDPSIPAGELSAVKERLVSVRTSLQKACRELDEQIRELDLMQRHQSKDERLPQISLFEQPPSEPETHSLRDHHAAGNIIFEATSPSPLSPELEQATLEDLNEALTQAFAQIAGRNLW